MNNPVVTTSPVIMLSQPSEHPVVTHKGTLRGIGITGFVIGLYAIGLGIYYWCATGNFSNGYYNHDIIRPFGWLYVCSGIWFIVCGSLAIAVGNNPNRCLITGGIVVAILASFVAFGLMIKEAYIAIYMISWCQDSTCDDESSVGILIAHSILAILSLTEFIIVIIHASYNCACCGGTYGPPIASTMTVTTNAAPMMQPAYSHGKGYAPLYNENDGRFTQTQVQHQNYPVFYQ